MTQFAPIELCKKLQDIGCRSENYFYWTKIKNRAPEWKIQFFPSEYVGKYYKLQSFNLSDAVMAFTQNDFTGATEQADENCKIVWGSHQIPLEYSCGNINLELFFEAWKAHKMQMISCHHQSSREVWFGYLERTRILYLKKNKGCPNCGDCA